MNDETLKAAKRLGSKASTIVCGEDNDKSDARIWITLIYIGWCLMGAAIGHALEVALVGGFFFIFGLGCLWEKSAIKKAYLKGNSCLDAKDYNGAITAYTEVIRLQRTASRCDDRAEQDPRDMMGD